MNSYLEINLVTHHPSPNHELSWLVGRAHLVSAGRFGIDFPNANFRRRLDPFGDTLRFFGDAEELLLIKAALRDRPRVTVKSVREVPKEVKGYRRVVGKRHPKSAGKALAGLMTHLMVNGIKPNGALTEGQSGFEAPAWINNPFLSFMSMSSSEVQRKFKRYVVLEKASSPAEGFDSYGFSRTGAVPVF